MLTWAIRIDGRILWLGIQNGENSKNILEMPRNIGRFKFTTYFLQNSKFVLTSKVLREFCYLNMAGWYRPWGPSACWGACCNQARRAGTSRICRVLCESFLPLPATLLHRRAPSLPGNILYFMENKTWWIIAC